MKRPSRSASADEPQVSRGDAEHGGLRRRGRRAHLPGFDLDLGRDLRHAGNRGGDGFEIALRQTDRGLANLFELLAVVGAGAHQDVVHPEPLDHRQGFSLGAGSDREHRDHRAHAEHDAEHGEGRAHLVRRQVRERDDERVARLHPPPMKAASALRKPAGVGVAAGLGERDPAAGVETGSDHGEAASERAHLDRCALEVVRRSAR